MNPWELLSTLVAYPQFPPGPYLGACARAWESHAAVAAALERFGRRIAEIPMVELQESYCEVFDFGTSCTLDVGWHLFGESRERGLFLATLVEELANAGIERSSELPDHLTQVLALIGREDTVRAGTLAALVEPAAKKIQRALAERGSTYAPLLEAIRAALETVAVRESGVSGIGR
jgi:nitrate reductase delta subunit